VSTSLTPVEATSARRARFLDSIDVRSYGIVLSFLTLFVVLSLTSPVFLTQRNLLNILDQSAPVGIVACGVTIGIIAGVFDLSVGAIFAVAAVAACKLALVTDPWLGIAAGILFGAVLGIVNGVLVNVIQINSFIATLASSIVFRGIAILVTGGLIVTVTDERFSFLGTETLLGAKYTVWVFALFIVATSFLLTRTTLGRYFYAVGGNARAARLSGVPVGRVRTIAFIISGLSRVSRRRHQHHGWPGGHLAGGAGRADPGHDRQRVQSARHRHDLPADRARVAYRARSWSGPIAAPAGVKLIPIKSCT
jgi:ribose transport system permease protein